MGYEQIENTVDIMATPITTRNIGKKLVETNYFDHPAGKAGIFYLSCNDGALRLLVPDSKDSLVAEMKTGNRVEIEVDPDLRRTAEAMAETGEFLELNEIKIFFEDDSGQPFSVFIGSEQCDRKLKRGKCKFLVYTREGLQASFRCQIDIPEVQVNLI